jgi:hypothetical protein
MRSKRPKPQKLRASYYEGWQKALLNQDFFEIEAIKQLVHSFQEPVISRNSSPVAQHVSYFMINLNQVE